VTSPHPRAPHSLRQPLSPGWRPLGERDLIRNVYRTWKRDFCQDKSNKAGADERHVVMPAPVAGIHVLDRYGAKDVDGRDKPGHDDVE
jgi:hypothetical protein